MNDQIDMNQQKAQAMLYCEFFPFEEELEQGLSASLKVTSPKPRYYSARYALPLPLVEMVLLFASTTVATSILTKLGEDIYNQLKAKIVKGLAEKGGRITITIVTDEVSAQGHVAIESYETAFEALKDVPQLIVDAHMKQESGLKGLPVTVRFPGTAIQLFSEDIVEPLTVLRSEFCFVYKYDTSARRWILQSIHRIRPQNKT